MRTVNGSQVERSRTLRAAWPGTVLVAAALLACAAEPTEESAGQLARLSAGDEVATVAAVEALLDAQVAAWNRGDIPGFMSGYWEDERLRFASGGSVQRGWRATLDRYLARYPDRAAMGTLRFEDREMDLLSAEAALVFGRWILDRADDQPQGLFTLVVRRFEEHSANDPMGADGWRVVADHTSSAD